MKGMIRGGVVVLMIVTVFSVFVIGCSDGDLGKIEDEIEQQEEVLPMVDPSKNAECNDDAHFDIDTGNCICDDGYHDENNVCVINECNDDLDCDDDIACNGAETCVNSTCHEEVPVECGEFGYCTEPTGDCNCQVGYLWDDDAQDCTEQETLANFNDLALEPESFWNGSDASGDFTSGSVTFNNNYNDAWGTWDGFAYSNITDTETPGLGNQYSAMTGGIANPTTYALSYYSAWALEHPTATINDAGEGVTLDGVYITNTVYTYYSMRDGDEFAKKFGGETGDDPDWFLLTISGIDNAGVLTGVVEFYLADHRSDDNDQDYIIDEWTWVDLSSLGKVLKLEFELNSSDVGDWGINTPTYFALDSMTKL
jgi:hypothetical protein